MTSMNRCAGPKRMMKNMKLKQTIWALALVALVASCDKATEPLQNSEVAAATTGSESAVSTEPLNLSLDAGVLLEDEDGTPLFGDDADELKSFKYKVGASGTERDVLPEGKPLHSLCIISNSTGSKHYYVELEWKKAEGDDRFYVKELDVKTQGSTTGIGNLSVENDEKWFIKGFLTYNKGNIKTRRVDYAPNGTGATLALEAQALNGSSKVMDVPFYFDWTPLYVDQTYKGKEAQNTAKTTADAKTSRGIVFKPFGSMARISLTNQENYQMKVKGLTLVSNVLTPSHGYVNLANPTWPNATTQKLDFVKENVKATLPITLSDGPISINAGKTHANQYVLWLMPQTPARGVKASTQLMANVVRVEDGQEQTYPKMSTLYIWGSDAKGRPGDRKRYHVQAKLHRPKLALEYISNGYKQGKDRNATFGPNSDTHFKYNEIEAYVPQGYRTMSYADAYTLGWHGLYYSQINTRAYSGDVNATIAGENYYARSTWQQVGTTVYALRFIDAHGGKQRSAWRYVSGSPNRIECVYLGPNFKGDFEDIKKPEFWTLHSNDIVVRRFNTAQTKLYGADANAWTHKYSGWALSWLSGAAPLPNGESKDGNWVWTLSPSTTDNAFIMPKYSNTGKMIGRRFSPGRPVNMSVPLIMIQSDDSRNSFNP